MAANYGINVSISNGAASPISVQSDTPIGIVAGLKLEKAKIYELSGYEVSEENPLFGFSNASKAQEFIGDLVKNNNLDDTRLIDTLTCIANQNVSCVIIISFFEEAELENDSDTTNISACVEAINALKNAKHRTGFKPDLIIAPYYSHEVAVKNALESVATKLKITAITDLYAKNVGEAINAMQTYSSKRLLACYPFVQIFGVGGYKYVPQSPIIAAMIAATDGEIEYGFSNSYSNRVMLGVSGVASEVDFEMGEDCDADRLRKNHISTCILYEGYRSWGGETSDEDSIWQDLARVRVFDRIAEAAAKASFKAIDKRADQLYFVKLSVEELLRNLKGAKVLTGYDVSWDDEKNTPTNVSAGKFYLNVKMMNNPIVKQITIDFIYSDEYSEDLLKSIS